MYVPFFRYGCALEINAARTSAYLTNIGDVCTTGEFPGAKSLTCNCPPLLWEIPDDEIGDPTEIVYTNPIDDAAPWYDADVPESGQFLGFLVNDVVQNSIASRTVSTRVSSSGGGVLGPIRKKERRFDFTVLMFACNESAMEYGFRYLTDVLNAGGCCDNNGSECILADAEYRDSCPSVDGTLPSLNRGRWLLKNVGAVEGPTWEKPPIESMACNARMVKFSIVSEMPWKFKAPVTVAEELELAGYPDWTGGCGNVEAVLCEQQYVYTSAAENLVVGESGMVIAITAGSVPLQHIEITITPDPEGYEVAPDTAPIDYVFQTPSDQITIPWIPAGSVLRYDTSVETVTVTTSDGVVVDGSPYISTQEGTPPVFPTLRCGAFAIRIGVSECSVIGDPTVTIQTIHREI